jgi:nucleoside-diphosphate-sugar epimerase
VKLTYITSLASKIAAFNRAEAWIKRERPPFDAIHIHPAFILGRDDMLTTEAQFQTGTNNLVLNVALGKASPTRTLPNNFTSVENAAELHVLALNPVVPGNQSFIASNTGEDGMSFNDVRTIVDQHYPQAVKAGVFPNTGSYTSVVARVDNRKTTATFGLKFDDFESPVISVLDHYLEIIGRPDLKTR